MERAGRVADFLELGELMAKDALEREESCGGHFREEYQTPDNEAQRNDEKFLKTTKAYFAPDADEPRFEYEAVDTSYIKPRPRRYDAAK